LSRQAETDVAAAAFGREPRPIARAPVPRRSIDTEPERDTMDRRVVIAGLAAVAAAPAAFAQTSSGQGAATTGSATQMSQAEQQWIQQTLAKGAVALETSRIAQKKAQDDDLKQFAKFEVDEQEGLAEVLKSMMPSGAAQPATDAKGQEMVQKLEQEKAGAGFDKAYHQGQLQGHRELLQIQESFLKSGGQNREATNVAKLARGRIQEHIELLESYEL
jgi:putative membrane protein